MRRITKAALGGLAGCALTVGGAGVASGELELLDFLKVHKDTMDVNNSTVALDNAKAKITIDKGTDSEGRPNTTFTIRVTGIDVSGIDFSQPVKPLGSHLHTGNCVEGDFGDPLASPTPILPGAQAGPHYNHDVALAQTPVRISSDTEVWFDLVPNQDGMAYDRTTVPFVPIDIAQDGVMSIVVHVDSTNPTTGAAGARQACFPLDVSKVFPQLPSE